MRLMSESVVCLFLPGQVSSEAVAEPIISEEGRGLSRKKKKHRVSEPGALVIEHAEPSDAGQSEPLVHIQSGSKTRSRGASHSLYLTLKSLIRLQLILLILHHNLY